MKKKVLSIIAVITLAVCMLAGCGEEAETSYTNDIMTNAYDAVGFPDVSNYFERSQLKEIYEMRDDPQLICYWYTKNDMTGKWVYQGKCVGYGIPYTTSMTASESLQRVDTTTGYERVIIPQAEPNGLYSSPSTSATWILSVDEDGNITPTYVEDCITVSQTKIQSRLCEDWSLTSDYDYMPDKAEIEGEVDECALEEAKEQAEKMSTEEE